MPTTSQFKVFEHLNIPNSVSRKFSKKRKKQSNHVLKFPEIGIGHTEKDQNFSESDEGRCKVFISKIPTLPLLSSTVENRDNDNDNDTNDVDEDTAYRLHQLGFWNGTANKPKIGISEPKDIDWTEFNNQYTQKLVDGIMEQVQKAAAKKEPPEEIPTALCFNLKGSIATHQDVKEKIDSLLYLCREECKVNSIQFFPLKTRWMVIMDKKYARDCLAGNELDFRGHKVMLRRYDDIAALEFRTYERANGLLQIVNNPF